MVSFDYRKAFRRRIEVRIGSFHYRKACWRLVEVSIGWGSILTTLKCVGDLCQACRMQAEDYMIGFDKRKPFRRLVEVRINHFDLLKACCRSLYRRI